MYLTDQQVADLARATGTSPTEVVATIAARLHAYPQRVTLGAGQDAASTLSTMRDR